MGEKKFTDAFVKYHIKKNAGWMIGLHALGLPNHNNAIESDHRHHIHGLILSILGNATSTSKYSIAFFLTFLRERFIKHLSMLQSGEPFEKTPEVSSLDQANAAR